MPNANFYSVKLIKAGTVSGNEGCGGELLSTTDTEFNFGGPGELWGNTLSPTDVNASNFGVAISFVGTNFVYSNLTTRYLAVTGYGFAIPAAASVKGVMVMVEASTTGSGSGTVARVDQAKMTVYYEEPLSIGTVQTMIRGVRII